MRLKAAGSIPNTRSAGRAFGLRNEPRNRLSWSVRGCSPVCEPFSRRIKIRRSCHWMSDQHRSQSSEMRRPWLKAIQIAAASRTPCRFLFCHLAKRQHFIAAQMLAWTAFLIRDPTRPEPNCSILSIWGRVPRGRNALALPRPHQGYCSITTDGTPIRVLRVAAGHQVWLRS